jgi:hypothetical protein
VNGIERDGAALEGSGVGGDESPGPAEVLTLTPVSPLAFSIVASIVLTVVLNVALRVFPGAGRRVNEGLTQLAERQLRDGDGEPGRSKTRVIVPWKAMIVTSIALTVAINLALWLLR